MEIPRCNLLPRAKAGRGVSSRISHAFSEAFLWPCAQFENVRGIGLDLENSIRDPRERRMPAICIGKLMFSHADRCI